MGSQGRSEMGDNCGGHGAEAIRWMLLGWAQGEGHQNGYPVVCVRQRPLGWNLLRWTRSDERSLVDMG